MTQSDILLKHLSTVFDPELGANIVELGMVKDVQHVDKTVTIKLALTIADCPMRNQIETEINRKLKLLDTECKIPSLDEMLHLVDGQTPILIEIKSGFNPEIELIENLGNEKIAYMKKEQHQLSAKIPSNIEIGSKIGFDLNDIFIFDENGKRLKS